MRYRYFITIIFSVFAFFVKGESINWVTDTIDYGKTRIFLNVPEQSCQTSTYIYDDEGFWIIYPIFPNSNKIASLTVNYSVMNKNYLYNTEDYDYELWNCLNINQIGSRCFKKNGLFYRIDRFEDGLEIFYIDIDNNNVDMANEIIRSVSKLAKSEKDIPLNKNKRKIIDETRK